MVQPRAWAHAALCGKDAETGTSKYSLLVGVLGGFVRGVFQSSLAHVFFSWDFGRGALEHVVDLTSETGS